MMFKTKAYKYSLTENEIQEKMITPEFLEMKYGILKEYT